MGLLGVESVLFPLIFDKQLFISVTFFTFDPSFVFYKEQFAFFIYIFTTMPCAFADNEVQMSLK